MHSANRRRQFSSKHSFTFFLLSLFLVGDVSIGCSGEKESTEQEPAQVEPAPPSEPQGQEPAAVTETVAPKKEEPLAMAKREAMPDTEAAPSAEPKTVMAMAAKKPAMQEEEAALSAHVTATALNVRFGPGTKNRVVGIVLKYDPVTITDRRRLSKSTWYNIEAAGGYVDGWVSGAYVSLSPPPGEVRAEVVDYGAQETPTLVKGSFKYVGVTGCKKCHVKSTGQFPTGAFRVWNGHFHADAFRSLSRNYTREIAKRVRGIDDPGKDWRCVKCHVTAHGADASQIAETYRDADGVGCEVCHGPGSGYAEVDHGPSNPDRYSLGFYKLENLEDRETLCVSCHNPTSPTYKPFNILAFSREIQHWPDSDDAAYFEHAKKVGGERAKQVAALSTQPVQDSPPAAQTQSPAPAAEAQAKAEQMKQVAEVQAKAEQMKQAAEAQTKTDEARRAQETAQAEQLKQAAEAQSQAAQMKREAEEKARAEEAERKAQEALERKKAQEQAEAERQKQAAEAAAKTASAAATGVERHLAGLAAAFTLNPDGKKYQTVRFTHSAHADKNYVTGIQCQTCHHTQEGDEKPEKCLNCHAIDGDAEETKLKTRATHSKAHPFPKESADQEQVSCIGCHKTQNSLLEAGQRSGKQAPTKCTGCHKKKST